MALQEGDSVRPEARQHRLRVGGEGGRSAEVEALVLVGNGEH